MSSGSNMSSVERVSGSPRPTAERPRARCPGIALHVVVHDDAVSPSRGHAARIRLDDSLGVVEWDAVRPGHSAAEHRRSEHDEQLGVPEPLRGASRPHTIVGTASTTNFIDPGCGRAGRSTPATPPSNITPTGQFTIHAQTNPNGWVVHEPFIRWERQDLRAFPPRDFVAVPSHAYLVCPGARNTASRTSRPAQRGFVRACSMSSEDTAKGRFAVELALG